MKKRFKCKICQAFTNPLYIQLRIPTSKKQFYKHKWVKVGYLCMSCGQVYIYREYARKELKEKK